MVGQVIKLVSRSIPPIRGGLRGLLGPEERAALDAIALRSSLDAGRSIYDEGDPGLHLCIVESGLVMLERVASDGARQVVGFEFPEDMFGIPLNGAYMQSAVALKPTRVLRYPYEKLRHVVREHPKVDDAIHRIMNRVLAAVLDQLCVLGRMTARERVVYLLLHLADREGKAHEAPLVVDVPMTRTDIADFLGLTVETVSRTISELKRQGIIHLRDTHQIEIRELGPVDAIAERFRHA